jgi:hypothetical protein
MGTINPNELLYSILLQGPEKQETEKQLTQVMGQLMGKANIA